MYITSLLWLPWTPRPSSQTPWGSLDSQLRTYAIGCSENSQKQCAVSFCNIFQTYLRVQQSPTLFFQGEHLGHKKKKNLKPSMLVFDTEEIKQTNWMNSNINYNDQNFILRSKSLRGLKDMNEYSYYFVYVVFILSAF